MCTFQFLRQILGVNLQKFRNELKGTQEENAHAKQLLTEVIPDRILKEGILIELHEVMKFVEAETLSRIAGRLNNPYLGAVLLPDKMSAYFNLCDRELSDEHKELLFSGTKFHYGKKLSIF